ncbi:GMC oxidoreductase [Streptomyces naphthomycinicus]|uniref:GMC oxidoreductase n=1 Tax=Streptomyces naphthomycinicus TaxID=2872625 RepID=UPI001CED7506|nr:GMC family oxidoreductase [Streptomyces sp. TML10]
MTDHRAPGTPAPRADRTVEHVDAVVVGSGFGGAVAAYRLAEAGLSVVVLERGRAYPPGGFARTPAEFARAFWDPAAGLYGLFDVWSFRGCDAVVASGLGGGSLIYANVLLRKDEHWFAERQPLPGGGHESWPVDRADLEPHYDAVERMLGATPYPLDRPGYADTPKTLAMREAAAALGLEFRLPPLAVAFAPEPGAAPGPGLPLAGPGYGNLHGAARRTCRLCGECNIGCNEGAKNSLDLTYLSAARTRGADLRTGHEAQAVRPGPRGGYLVDYVRHPVPEPPQPPEPGSRPTAATLACDRLVLAAGTLGTIRLLLRSRNRLPGLGPALGTRFSGNGDTLSFLLRAKDGSTGRSRPLNPSQGPVITSALRLPDALDGVPGAGRGGYIEDGGYPQFVQWLAEGARGPQQLSRAARFLTRRLADRIGLAPRHHLSGDLSDLLGDGLLTSTSLPLLGMGRDTPDGELRLRGGRLDVSWTAANSADGLRRIRSAMRRIADVLGAGYADNPLWHLGRTVTVHPLGGAPMGHRPETGVCDPFGEVYGHPGLYIADGSAMPGPVGVNPSLTIAALADRMSTRMLEARAGGGAAPAPRPAYTRRTALVFTETMRGYYVPGAADPAAAERGGRREPFTFRLTVTADGLHAFLDDPGHEARADGWLESPACGGRRPVVRGRFHLFAPTGHDNGPTTLGTAPDEGVRRVLRYRLHFTDAEERPRTFAGAKRLTHGAPLRLWSETTELPFRVLAGHTTDPSYGESAVLGAGRLRLGPADLARQLATFRTTGPGGAAALARFGEFFLGRLRESYAPRIGRPADGAP